MFMIVFSTVCCLSFEYAFLSSAILLILKISCCLETIHNLYHFAVNEVMSYTCIDNFMQIVAAELTWRFYWKWKNPVLLKPKCKPIVQRFWLFGRANSWSLFCCRIRGCPPLVVVLWSSNWVPRCFCIIMYHFYFLNWCLVRFHRFRSLIGWGTGGGRILLLC